MPSPMDYCAHELHDPTLGSTIQGNNNNDVMALQSMLAAAEQQEAEHRRAEQQQLAKEIYEEYEPPKHQPPMGKAPDISEWLSDITQKDSELRKNADVTRLRSSLPPVRNADKGPKKRVQVGPSTVEKEKAAARGEEKAPKGPSKKQQKYYSYDYFKEWDKFDVDKEIERIEDEEKKQEEFRTFAKKAADVDKPEDVHDPASTYQIDDMTPLEKRVAAKREKEKGNECMKAGEINAAVGFYTKALELVPGDHLVLGNRAQAYIGIKCYYQAELDCDKALAIEPAYAKGRYRRAVAREEQGKLQEAKEDYDTLLRESPDHDLGRKRYAVLEVKLRKQREAEEALRKAEEERQRYDAAPRRKIQITELDDEDEDDDDGMDAEALKKAREAIKQKEDAKKPATGSRFAEVTDEEESDEKKSRKLKNNREDELLRLGAARAEKDKGNERFKAKDLVSAVRHYSRSLKLLPADDTEEKHLVLCNRALVLLQQNKFSEAEADCTAAIAANAKWAKAWHRRGVARYKGGRLGEALEDLEAALKLEPNSKSTLDEIKIVRDMQLEAAAAQRKAAAAKPAAPKMRVQIEEVETDSEDDDVVVINSPGSKNKPGPQGDKDRASPPNTGPGAPLPAPAPKKVAVLEVEDDDSDAEAAVPVRAASGDEGEVLDDDEAVSVAPSGRQSSQAAGKSGMMIEEVDEDDEDTRMEATSANHNAGVPPEALGAGRATKKVAIEEVDSDNEEGEVAEDSAPLSAPPGAAPAVSLSAGAVGSTKIVVVEDDDDSDDDGAMHASSEANVAPQALAAAAKRAAWEEAAGVDLAKLRAAKQIKEEADAAFKNALFEKGAVLYSSALETLGYGEDTLPEQAVCCLNRAACNLQVREYGQVIADCGQVLDLDPDNVKAYLRRGLAYEGTGRFSKAAADMRDLLSIEFASGGLTSLGSKAKECLERCKKAEPDLRAIPIPVREKIVREGATVTCAAPAGPAAAASCRSRAVSAEKPATEVDASGCAEEDIDIVMNQTGVNRTRAVSALKAHKDAAGAILAIEDENDGTPAHASGAPAEPAAAAAAATAESAAAGKKEGSDFKFGKQKEDLSPAERQRISKRMEAEDEKDKGNAAFKAGKYRSAIMHYSAAIDLDDNNATYYTNLSAAHNALKDYENGLKMALAARRADASYAKGVYRHAQSLQGLGRLREALRVYEEGLALMPQSKQLADGRTEVAKAIRDTESSEAKALAQLKAIKEEEEARRTAAAAAAAAEKALPASDGSSKPAGGGPKSGADFKKAMRSMRKDMAGLFSYAKLCAPEQLPKLFSSGLEEDELVLLVRCVAEHGAAADPQKAFELLQGLVKVPRVAIVTGMLDRKDAKMLEALLLRLHPSKANEAAAAVGAPCVAYDVQRWADIRKSYGF